MRRFSIFKLTTLTILVAILTLFSEITLADGATNDTLACYSWDQFPNERFNLGIRGGGPLSSPQDEENYNQPAQRTHGVHAKHVGVCGRGTNGAVEGVVVTATDIGAHMGLHTMVTRGGEDRGDDETCRPVFLDCYSEQDSKAPDKWICKSSNEFGTYHGDSTLTLVALDTAPDDPRCEVFEDEDAFESSSKSRRGPAASGTLRAGNGRNKNDD